MNIIDDDLLKNLNDKALNNNRLRQNYNLHESLDDKVQQLLNALDPGTVLPVHRHTDTIETYLMIRGRLMLLLYNKDREIIKK